MHLYIYAGPFARCSPKGACDYYSLIGDTFTDLSGEVSRDSDILGPNSGLNSLTRAYLWEKNGESDEIAYIGPSTRDLEIAWFKAKHHAELKLLAEHYESVVVHWGIVPGWH